MHLAVSNIALPSFGHEPELKALADLGFEGLEVAPSKVWENTSTVSPAQARNYRQQVEQAGLRVVGLHSLFFDRPDLGLFRGPEVRKQTLEFLTGLSRLCADLGGRFLVFGSPPARRRGDRSVDECDIETVAFFQELSGLTAGHGTAFLIEALGRQEADYIHTAAQALAIARRVDRPELQGHLDAKAVAEAGEDTPDLFQEMAPTLVHFHANDPGLGLLGSTGTVDHARLGGLLRDIGYSGFVSLEQRMLDPDDVLGPIRASLKVMEECY